MKLRSKLSMLVEISFLGFAVVSAFFFAHSTQKNLQEAGVTKAATIFYYVSPEGNDSNPGNFSQPWKTMQRAVEDLRAGDTLYVREGTYETIEDAWRFQATGTSDSPITVRNYPNEQAIFKINSLRMERRAFRCGTNTALVQANHIKLLGSDVSSPRTLSNGVVSRKGLVVLGISGANAIGIESNLGGCNSWEVAGFDFVETGGGVFQRNGPSENWYVHDNRVHNFYRESGMQFNGHNNQVVGNEIYLVNSLPRTYGCQMINLLGHGNIVRNNVLSREGSTHRCIGVLFEWDMADANVVEQNTIYDVPTGIGIQGGDNNIIRGNVINSSAVQEPNGSGVRIASYDNRTGWPCDEMVSPSSVLLPPNDPGNSDYKYFYNPRNCHSMYNQIVGNQISGFSQAVSQSPVADNTNVILSMVIASTSPTSTPVPTASLTPTPRPTQTPSPRPTAVPTPTTAVTSTPTLIPTSVPIALSGRFKGEYFNNPNFDGNPVLIRNDESINFDWGRGSPHQLIRNSRFSVRWIRTAYFVGGNYRFTLSHDDGLRVYVDGKLIYNRWASQSALRRTIDRRISQGNHAVKVEYYENYGLAKVSFSYEKFD